MFEIEDLKKIGGRLECVMCGRLEPLGDPAARVMGAGWPTCCGYTMTWVTERQLRERKAPGMSHD